MTIIGYHASHEQHPPSRLLADVRSAAELGFDAFSCSDHFAPWSSAQGHSGHAWSWLGAAMAAVSGPFGVVTAPGQRYHPAVLAQAIATLGEMFPERLWVALGSGEALNEHITGGPWPTKSERHERLLECVQILRALFAGEEVSWEGHVRVDRARLWTRPAVAPALVGAALTEETARWCGSWADGLVTLGQSPEQVRAVTRAFRAGGGGTKPVRVQVKLCWDPDEERALAMAHEQWRTNVLGPSLCADLETVEHFEAAGALVRPEDMTGHVLVSADTEHMVKQLRALLDAGADELFLHQVGRDQRPFLNTFATAVLPALR